MPSRTSPATLKDATERAVAALDAGEMEALGRALKDRRAALASGDRPTQEVFEAGERLLRGLMALQQRTAFESARLGQIRTYVEFRK